VTGAADSGLTLLCRINAPEVEISVSFIGELTIDYAGYRRITAAALKAGRFRVVGLLFVLIGTLLAFTGGSLKNWLLLILSGAFLIIVWDLLVALGWRRTVGLTGRPWRYEINDSSVGIHTSQTNVVVQWAGISKARAGKHAWLLTLSNRAVIAIPRAAFTTESQEQISKLVEAHRG
jgi:hypothetical protein